MRGSNGGPKSKAGKAAVRHNAIKHGMASESPVIPGMEDEAEWQAHVDGVVASFAPEGYLEQLLAERFANLFWRMNRVTRYEVAVTTYQVGQTLFDRTKALAYLFGIKGALGENEDPEDNAPDPEPGEIALLEERRIVPYKDELDQIMRFETHFHRQALQILHELQALQARRRGEPVHLARLDISSPPAG